ncbi:MAG: hypothetical protein K6G30_14945 [Acetatifactor sp.]|nr:hypothetical protein [Acetatifactor sp.]
MKKFRFWMEEYQNGSVGDLAGSCLCILGMTIVMFSYLHTVALLQEKLMVSQVARKYILRMETVGYLTPADKTEMRCELENIGVTDICLDGTTMVNVPYGSAIQLKIAGKLGEKYDFTEERMSSAKH